jgi:hypothetical protein
VLQEFLLQDHPVAVQKKVGQGIEYSGLKLKRAPPTAQLVEMGVELAVAKDINHRLILLQRRCRMAFDHHERHPVRHHSEPRGRMSITMRHSPTPTSDFQKKTRKAPGFIQVLGCQDVLRFRRHITSSGTLKAPERRVIERAGEYVEVFRLGSISRFFSYWRSKT